MHDGSLPNTGKGGKERGRGTKSESLHAAGGGKEGEKARETGLKWETRKERGWAGMDLKNERRSPSRKENQKKKAGKSLAPYSKPNTGDGPGSEMALEEKKHVLKKMERYAAKRLHKSRVGA